MENMINIFTRVVCISAFMLSAFAQAHGKVNVVTDDIERFWQAFDRIVVEADYKEQVNLINSLYVKPGTAGLQKIMQVRGYTAEQYVDLINRYPKFWRSLRANTLKAKQLSNELNQGLDQFNALYKDTKPATVYFTMGAMRTNGTTLNDAVLIGSELAMADAATDISEFSGRTKTWLTGFFATNPIENLVLLNVHEFIHTQQTPIEQSLLMQVMYEGVAEFLSVLAMKTKSQSPAIAYGKSNPQVKLAFENEMFFERTSDWLWSSSQNKFNVRDLGYYIGYSIAENYYQQAIDKTAAIKALIELDYSDSAAVEAIIDSTKFFTKPIEHLRELDIKRRPLINKISEFTNFSQSVSPSTKTITVNFSDVLNGHNNSIDYGDKGKKALPEILSKQWANDKKSWTMHVNLKPNTHYQLMLSNFRDNQDVPIQPYLIEFKTTN